MSSDVIDLEECLCIATCIAPCDPDRSYPAVVEPRASIAFSGTASVVVIGSTGDPATLFAMAEQMVAGIIARTLLTATAPAAGTAYTQQI